MITKQTKKHMARTTVNRCSGPGVGCEEKYLGIETHCVSIPTPCCCSFLPLAVCRPSSSVICHPQYIVYLKKVSRIKNEKKKTHTPVALFLPFTIRRPLSSVVCHLQYMQSIQISKKIVSRIINEKFLKENIPVAQETSLGSFFATCSPPSIVLVALFVAVVLRWQNRWEQSTRVDTLT